VPAQSGRHHNHTILTQCLSRAAQVHSPLKLCVFTMGRKASLLLSRKTTKFGRQQSSATRPQFGAKALRGAELAASSSDRLPLGRTREQPQLAKEKVPVTWSSMRFGAIKTRIDPASETLPTGHRKTLTTGGTKGTRSVPVHLAQSCSQIETNSSGLLLVLLAHLGEFCSPQTARRESIGDHQPTGNGNNSPPATATRPTNQFRPKASCPAG